MCVWGGEGGDPPETEIAAGYGIGETVSNRCEKIQLDLELLRCMWDIFNPLETIGRKIPRGTFLGLPQNTSQQRKHQDRS